MTAVPTTRTPQDEKAPHVSSCSCVSCLVARHLDLAETLSARFRRRGEADDDLIQVARLGLVLAAQRYDPQAGTPFGGYAVPTILGELRRHLRDRVWGVRPPRSLQELRPQVAAAVERLTQSLRRAPTQCELAEELAQSPAIVAEVQTLDSAYRPDSLDGSPDAPGAPGALAEVLRAPQTRLEDLGGLAEVLAALPESHQQVLRLHYWDDLSQRRIAARVGISQMQVSRLLRQSVEMIRRDLSAVN